MRQTASDHQPRAILQRIADRAMIERDLLPSFSPAVTAEVEALSAPTDAGTDGGIRDQRHLLWASIDNDDSRDLDQLTVAEAAPGDAVRIRVAVADVDAVVRDGSAIDEHARHNTTSVYTAAKIFPMLPERLSTDLTSLNPGEDRLAVVIDMLVGADGVVRESAIYRALVHNHARLAYGSVAAWLDGRGAAPERLAAVPGLAENLREQDRVAGRLRALRHVQGALRLRTLQARPIFEGDRLHSLGVQQKDRATELIEDFMIAANGVTARYLAARKVPSIRRVVRLPNRWDRIVELAAARGTTLPANPDSAALDAFLTAQHALDPLRFADLSLSVIKLLGSGEYVAEQPGGEAPGHFGLAVRDYTHATAPNRRYPDLITQRLLKAAIADRATPYGYAELEVLAKRFTKKEDDASKVERHVAKSAAAMLLEPRIGERFRALVTGASTKGTWARLIDLPVEGRVVHGTEGLDVGEEIQVQLAAVDVERGFIDFRSVDGARGQPARSVPRQVASSDPHRH